MNKVVLLGRLTRDPETRYTQTNNTCVANFTLAVNRRFAKDSEIKADFIPIVAWNKTGEFVSKYFQKGKQVAVVGRIQTRNWEDDQGQKHYATEVIAEEVYFADSANKTDNYNDSFGDTFEVDTVFGDDDDLPF